jgi:hypothetical protein
MNTEQEAYRISSIKVEGLFGMFDHEIPLNLDERITIVYGENGIGKTMVFRMVDALLKKKFQVLENYPFGNLTVSFSNGDSINVSNQGRFLAMVKRLDSPDMVEDFIEFRNSNPQDRVFVLGKNKVEVKEKLLKYADDIRALGPHKPDFDANKSRIVEAFTAFADEYSIQNFGLLLDVLERFELFSRDLFHAESHDHDFDPIEEVLKGLSVAFIETNRLLIKEGGKMNPQGLHPEYSNTVGYLSADMAHKIQAAKAEYQAQTEALVKSLVQRLSSGNVKVDYQLYELRGLSHEIMIVRQELNSLGLLLNEEIQSDGEIADDLAPIAFPTVGINLHDIRESLVVYNDLKTKVRLSLRLLIKEGFHTRP